jgi:hypothetical protein
MVSWLDKFLTKDEVDPKQPGVFYSRLNIAVPVVKSKRPTTHTAATYHARYLRPGPNASVSRLFRYARMARRAT